MSEDSDAEKEHEPTQKRLDEARKRGEVIRSTDLTTAAAYGGLILACIAFGPAALQSVGQTGKVLIDQADRLAPLMISGEAAPIGGLILHAAFAVAPIFIIPALAVMVVLVATRAIVFSGEKLQPKLSRVSVIQNAGQKFGRTGLFEFAKSFVKLVIVSLLLGFFLMSRLPEILSAAELGPGQATVLLLKLVMAFLMLIFAFSLVMGAIDWLWQRFEFLRRNRMTRQELIDEMKESEGDPHLKQTRRQRAQEIAMNQMLADVPKADVIIVNPTHYAVALKWSRQDRTAPVCVAKGVDEIAAQIRRAAREAGVPIHSDPPTARAIHAAVEVGEQIRPEHYRAVAAAIRFAEKMRLLAKGRV